MNRAGDIQPVAPRDVPALRGLIALAAGHSRWKTAQLTEYAAQAELSGGFWMSLSELLAG